MKLFESSADCKAFTMVISIQSGFPSKNFSKEMHSSRLPSAQEDVIIIREVIFPNAATV
jgi:hypothetical protein